MEPMSKYFKLDNRKSFWQSDIYRKGKDTTMKLCLYKNLFTMNNNDIKQSYLQAFFAKKDREDTK